GPRQSQGLGMGHTVLREWFALGTSYHLIHTAVISLEYGDVVAQQQIIGGVQLALIGLPKSSLCFGKAAKEKQTGCKITVSDLHAGFGSDQLLGCLDRSFETSGSVGG